MKPSYQGNEFRTWRRILPLVAVALALVGPSRLCGQECQQGIKSLTITPGSITALANGPAGNATGTLTVNCPVSPGTVVDTSVSPANGILTCGPAGISGHNKWGISHLSPSPTGGDSLVLLPHGSRSQQPNRRNEQYLPNIYMDRTH